MLLLSIIIYLFSGNLSAQEQFRLSDYKNPDYKWKQLDIRFGMGGNNIYNRQEIERGTTDRKLFNRFQSSFDVNYYSTKNSRFYQGYQDIGLRGTILSNWLNNKNLTDDLSTKEKNNFQDFDLNALTVNRFYNSRKQFVEINLNLVSGISHYKDKYSADKEEFPFLDETRDLSYQVDASLPVMIGMGRIEEVQDARLAVYILDDLAKAGDLKRAPTSEETLAFAQFITQTKNQRYFDSRIRKIAEITAIDSLLTSLDLKAQSNASYYTLLNDNWDNSNGPERRTGGRFSIGVVPNIDLSINSYELFYRDSIGDPVGIASYSQKRDNRLNSLGMDAVTGYDWEKPSSLYWQHSVNADLAYSLYQEKINFKIYDMDTLTSEGKSRLDSPNLKLELGYSIGYFPNSRTNVRLGLTSSYNQYWGDLKINDDPASDVGTIRVNNRLSLSCYYYISQQLRFSLFISSLYSFIKENQELPDDEFGDEKTHDLQNSISASIIYSIF